MYTNNPRPNAPAPGRESEIGCVLFDLDGVLRHFDAEFVARVEARHGLAEGSLNRAAFEPALLNEVVTGRITRAEWIGRVGEAVGNADAAGEWGQQPFAADPGMLALADELRSAGYVVAILTNGTDTIDAELTQCGIAARVDRVFNSAQIGAAKPDPAAFLHVLESLGLSASEVVFTDDSQHKLDGAARLGMPTHLFRSEVGLRAGLKEALAHF